jgi:hypothetical protein
MSTPQRFQTAHAAALREWARGSYPLEAATELLICTQRGRFVETGTPWVHVEDNGRAWIDFDELAGALDEGGPWSGGERRLLILAVSLGADAGLLGSNVPGLDRDTLALVVAAVSHAGGSHEHTPPPILWDEDGQPYRNPHTARPGPLCPWPDTAS